MGQTKTDNKYLIDKIALRETMLPNDRSVKVLNAFGGKNKIWGAIKKIRNPQKIDVLSIDMSTDCGGIYLVGNNMKFISAMDLQKFDAIDLDAYGCPFDQLEIILNSGFCGIVFVTFIQVVNGALPDGFLEKLGFKKEMIKKCPSVFYREGLKKMLGYLNMYGIDEVLVKSKNRHNYIGFNRKQPSLF